MEYRPRRRRASLPSKPASRSKTRASAFAALLGPVSGRQGRRQGAAIPLGAVFPKCVLRRAPRPGNCRSHRRCGSRHALGLRLGTGPVRDVGRARRRIAWPSARAREARRCRRWSTKLLASRQEILLRIVSRDRLGYFDLATSAMQPVPRAAGHHHSEIAEGSLAKWCKRMPAPA